MIYGCTYELQPFFGREKGRNERRGVRNEVNHAVGRATSGAGSGRGRKEGRKTRANGKKLLKRDPRESCSMPDFSSREKRNNCQEARRVAPKNSQPMFVESVSPALLSVPRRCKRGRARLPKRRFEMRRRQQIIALCLHAAKTLMRVVFEARDKA